MVRLNPACVIYLSYSIATHCRVCVKTCFEHRVMPKVRRQRVRRHAAAAGTVYGKVDNTSNNGPSPTPVSSNPFIISPQLQQPTTAIASAPSATNMSTNTKTEDKDTPTASSTGKFKNKVTKKEKMLQRRKRLRNRLLLPGDSAKFSSPDKGISSLSSLTDMLPSAEESVKQRQDTRGKNMTDHTRKEIAKSEISQFTNVLAHPAFRNNPLAALRAHLKNSQEEEQESQAKLNSIAGVKPQRKKKNGGKKSKKKKKSTMSD